MSTFSRAAAAGAGPSAAISNEPFDHFAPRPAPRIVATAAFASCSSGPDLGSRTFRARLMFTSVDDPAGPRRLATRKASASSLGATYLETAVNLAAGDGGLSTSRPTTKIATRANPRLTDRSLSSDGPGHDFMDFGSRASDALFELGFHLVRMFEQDTALQHSNDVCVDAMVPLAQLHIEAPHHFRVRFDDGAHARHQLCPSLGDVFATHELGLERLEVNVDT